MVVQTTLREMSCSCMNICCEIGKLKKTKKKKKKKKEKGTFILMFRAWMMNIQVQLMASEC